MIALVVRLENDLHCVILLCSDCTLGGDYEEWFLLGEVVDTGYLGLQLEVHGEGGDVRNLEGLFGGLAYKHIRH